jgi:pilus assembly protein Flp/PilA
MASSPFFRDPEIVVGQSAHRPIEDRRHQMLKTLARFFKDESGATAIEYGLIAAGISVAIVAILPTIGESLSKTFTTINGAL